MISSILWFRVCCGTLPPAPVARTHSSDSLGWTFIAIIAYKRIVGGSGGYLPSWGLGGITTLLELKWGGANEVIKLRFRPLHDLRPEVSADYVIIES